MPTRTVITPTLSTSDKRALSQTRNILNRLGHKVPSVLNTVRETPTTENYTPTKAEIDRFISALRSQKQVVVTIAGPAKRFTVFSVDGFQQRQRAGRSLNKTA